MKFTNEQISNNSKLVNLHSGHRKRFRANLISKDWDNFNEHQLMEYVLSVIIPRKDINDTAHLLINEFGSVANVLDADICDLKKVKGVGEVTATFLHNLPNVFKIYKKSKLKEKPMLSCPQKVFENFGELINHLSKEEFYVICVDSDSKLIASKQISSGTSNEVAFSLKTVTEYAVKMQASGIILIHNHPNGEPEPSSEDIEITRKIYLNMAFNNMALLDHIIVGKCDGSYYSFTSSGLMNDFKKQFNSIIDKQNIEPMNINYDITKI